MILRHLKRNGCVFSPHGSRYKGNRKLYDLSCFRAIPLQPPLCEIVKMPSHCDLKFVSNIGGCFNKHLSSYLENRLEFSPPLCEGCSPRLGRDSHTPRKIPHDLRAIKIANPEPARFAYI